VGRRGGGAEEKRERGGECRAILNRRILEDAWANVQSGPTSGKEKPLGGVTGNDPQAIQRWYKDTTQKSKKNGYFKNTPIAATRGDLGSNLV